MLTGFFRTLAVAARQASSKVRSGISPVISTVILTGILLTVISVALFFSTSLIDMNRQTMEYEHAKDQIAYAATVIEQVAFGTGGSRYIRFSMTSTGINFENQSLFLVVEIQPVGSSGSQCNPAPNACSASCPLCRFSLIRLSVRGGPLVTTVPRLIYPETGSLSEELSKTVVKPGEPLVVVYENFSLGAYTYVEPRRVRLVYNGAFNVTEKAAGIDCDGDGQLSNLLNCRFNLFTIHVARLVPGQVGGSGTIPVIFRNRGIYVYDYSFTSANVIVTARIVDGLGRVIATQQESTRAPPAHGCIVVVKVSEVEVSTV